MGELKKLLSAYSLIAVAYNISERGRIRPRFRLGLLRTNRKSHTRFRLVPKSTTLDDLKGSLCTVFQNTCANLFIIRPIHNHLKSNEVKS